MRLPATYLVRLLCVVTLAGCSGSAGDTVSTGGSTPMTTQIGSDGDTFGLDAREHLRVRQGELLVRFKAGTGKSAAQAVASKIGARSVRSFRSVPGLALLKLPAGARDDAALAALQSDDAVMYAEPNYILVKQALPNDPLFSQQWNLHNIGQTGWRPDVDIDAPEAWDITTGSDSVVIAVIDSGIAYDHPDLAANVFRNEIECVPDGLDNDGNGYVDDCHGIDTANGDSDPLDDEGHGTMVAGVIGAIGNNAIGGAGIAWHVKLLPCKFIDPSGGGSTADAVTCLDYVATLRDRGVNIVATNNSWGSALPSDALVDAIDAQLQRGVLFVTAAGNGGQDNDIFPQYPCAIYRPNVICTASIDDIGAYSTFSGRGFRSVLIGAPGEDVPTTTFDGGYGFFSGTSAAAPHVAGAIALLKAQDPSRDWRVLKNLAFTSVNPTLPEDTTSVMLNVGHAMTCTSSEVNRRLRPRNYNGDETGVMMAIGDPLELSVLHANCGAPAGDVSLTVQPGGGSVVLRDNGAGKDLVAGDGIYTAAWTATTAGTFTFSFPGQDDVVVKVDPYLERGFPLKTLHTGGTYHGGHSVHVVVGNIDTDPKLEILASGFASGPMYAWHADGSRVAGWPASVGWLGTAGYASLGEFDKTRPGSEVFVEYVAWDEPTSSIYYGNAMPMPNWPRPLGSSGTTINADLDGDGIDEIFSGFALRADGSLFNPDFSPQGNGNASAIADLDGDGMLDVVTVAGPGGISYGYSIDAQRANGKSLPGFPRNAPQGAGGQPLLGDVDGDGETEIVFLSYEGYPWDTIVRIVGSDGREKRHVVLPGDDSTTSGALALGDLDGDGFPEIIVQTGMLNVIKGDGSTLAGWPQDAGRYGPYSSVPVIGDVDGDGAPDVVSITSPGEVRIWDRHGTRLPGFSWQNILLGQLLAVPAIADVDLDGRNELVLFGQFWNGFTGDYDAVWVLDLHGAAANGPIEWGQYKGDAHHSGYYATGKNLATQAYLAAHVLGTGTVKSSDGGIDCGADCIQRYAKSTTVSLLATPGSGSTFVRWRGACSGTAPTCSLPMSNFRNVMAEFSDSSRLEVIVEGSGRGTVTASSGDISCPSTCEDYYVPTATVTLTATAAANSRFDGWSGACTGLATTCVVSMSEARSVRAWFREVRRLTATRAGDGTGQVITRDRGIECGGVCSAFYEVGTTMEVYATPDAGSTFMGWSGACSGINCEVTLDADRSVTATFALLPALAVTHSGSGFGTVRSNVPGIDCGTDCWESYDPAGAVVTLTATANPDSTFVGWSGACAGTGNCTLTVDAIKTANARFELRRALTVTRSGGGTGTVSSTPAGISCGADCQESFDFGAVVRLSASPGASSAFDGWSGGGCSGTAATCDVTVDADQAVTATFRPVSSGSGSGSGSSSGGGGGGRLDWTWLVAIAGLLAWRLGRQARSAKVVRSGP